MINMMYLVFIAMLALQISKEVLATLGILSEDMEKSTAELQFSIDSAYNIIDQNINNIKNYYRCIAPSNLATHFYISLYTTTFILHTMCSYRCRRRKQPPSIIVIAQHCSALTASLYDNVLSSIVAIKKKLTIWKKNKYLVS